MPSGDGLARALGDANEEAESVSRSGQPTGGSRGGGVLTRAITMGMDPSGAGGSGGDSGGGVASDIMDAMRGIQKRRAKRTQGNSRA